jgi:hypothetical protein
MAEHEFLPEKLPPRVREFLELLDQVYPGYISFAALPGDLQPVAKWCLQESTPQRKWLSVCCVAFDSAALPTMATEDKEGVSEALVDWVPCVPVPPQIRLAPDGHDRLAEDRLRAPAVEDLGGKTPSQQNETAELSPEDATIANPDDKLVRQMKGNSRCLLLHLWRRGNVSLDELRAVLWCEHQKTNAKAKRTTSKAAKNAVDYLERKLQAAAYKNTLIEKNGGMYFLRHPQK